MSIDYTARTAHKRPCDVCGRLILPGDACNRWMYVSENGPEGSNIMRAHRPCAEIADREQFEEWQLGRAFVGNTWLDEEEAVALQAEADAAVAAMRSP